MRWKRHAFPFDSFELTASMLNGVSAKACFRRCMLGISIRQGGHQLAQKFSSTT